MYWQQQTHPTEKCLSCKTDNTWKSFSTKQLVENANYVSYAFIELGFKPGDKVGSISNNRPEWNFADMGIMEAGLIHIPIYPTITASEYAFIINDASIKAVLISDEEIYNKIISIKEQCPSLEYIITFNAIPNTISFDSFIQNGKNNTHVEELRNRNQNIKSHDVATILYTSGTTGNPKGVMLMHSNIVSNVLDSADRVPVNHEHKALSFLPLCHSFERMLTYLYLYLGVDIYYAESMEKIGDNIKEVQPHVFSCVPRLLEKVYDKIVNKGNELKGIKRSLFFWALNLGLRYELDGKNGWWYEFQLKLANKIIFNKWREALGGNTKVIVSGGAALQVKLARVFWAAQLPVLEGYGLTETSPVISVNYFGKGNTKFGTVGTVIKNVEVKIAEDGEILSKGPNLMKGYYNRPDLTESAIDKDGWFHTGDIGTLEEGKYLKITDRKKEIFKNSGGKYIAPQVIENKMKESPFIEQIMVIGENQKYTAALVVPSFPYLIEWCKSNNISLVSQHELIELKEVRSIIRNEINRLNESLSQVEQIKKFELIDREWTIDNNELTPTLKLKRKNLFKANESLINKIYSNSN